MCLWFSSLPPHTTPQLNGTNEKSRFVCVKRAFPPPPSTQHIASCSHAHTHTQTAVVATTIIGAGGSNIKPLWDALSHDYKFSKDSIDIQYLPSRTDVALQRYINGEIDFCSTVVAFSEEQKMAVGNIIQLPLVATAISFAYHLDTLDPVEDSLVLDRSTLARIWAGNIVTWDDPAIAVLNKDLHAQGKLPHLNITFAYSPGGQVEMMKNALSSFSDEFRAAMAIAGNQFERLPPFLEGRATTGPNITARLDWVKVLFPLP